MRKFSTIWYLPLLLGLLAGCGGGGDTGHDHGHSHSGEEPDDNWSVTSWGRSFEIFAETDPLAAGQVSTSHTHVTALAGFSPLAEGRVSIILRDSAGSETVFTQDRAVRPGIFSISVTPPVDGVFALVFRVETGVATEEIPSGRVYVGSMAEPGWLIAAPKPPHGPASTAGASSPPVDFLKEQQWKTSFATGWLTEGTIRRTVDGFGTIRPAAGSDVIVAAPTNGIIAAPALAHVGMEVREGQELLRLLPRAVAEQSLSELRSELAFERLRLARLEKLIEIGGATQEEVDHARSRIAALGPLVEGDSESATLSIKSPLTGRIAGLWVGPGSSTGAGDSLMRLVNSRTVWIDVALDAARAAALAEQPYSLHLRVPGVDSLLSYSQDEFRLIARSPSFDPVTGNASVLLEMKATGQPLPLGATVEVSIGTAVEDTGVVVDVGALVDDGGTDVVYVQTGGEAFERHEVHVLRYEGRLALIDGLPPGVRVVTRGGAMIRRASMLSTGGIEGHVH